MEGFEPSRSIADSSKSAWGEHEGGGYDPLVLNVSTAP